MKYRIVMTILLVAVLAFVVYTKEQPTQQPTPPVPSDEPAMKGLQIN